MKLLLIHVLEEIYDLYEVTNAKFEQRNHKIKGSIFQKNVKFSPKSDKNGREAADMLQ